MPKKLQTNSSEKSNPSSRFVKFHCFVVFFEVSIDTDPNGVFPYQPMCSKVLKNLSLSIEFRIVAF